VVRTDQPETPDVSDGADDSRPGSVQELRHRLDNLREGHPSSPYNEDGTRKPAAFRLRDIELPEPSDPDRSAPDRPPPLTDAEHADHVQEVRGCLDKARSDGLATDQMYTIDRAREQWEPGRNRIHGQIVRDLYDQASDVPNDRMAIVAGGLPGSGKTTTLEQHAGIDRSQYLTINPDSIKEEMARRGLVPDVPGLSPMEASDLVHEESSHVAKRLALRAQADGKNIIWDITMRSYSSTEGRIHDLRMAGYTRIDGIFVDIPIDTSITRADARHREGHDDYLAGKGLGGRFVPEEVIKEQADPEWGSINRKTFEEVKRQLDSWSTYDNSVDGRGPVLADAPKQEEIAP
jgi:predicted kinase